MYDDAIRVEDGEGDMILGIYGAGGLGRELYDVAVRRNGVSHRWSDIVFIDDFSEEGAFFGTSRMHLDSLSKSAASCECIVAVGEPSDREKLFGRLAERNFELATLIDPTAIVSPTAKIGAGSIVCEYSTIHTCVEIGRNTLIQPYCTIGHDIKVGDHSVFSAYFAPGGEATFGSRVYAGMHASVLEKLTVGDDAVIGMGAAVFRDVPAGATVVGNPARITRGNDEHKVFAKDGNRG
jgi:sugar O-acyltransferase (sialic acid O-acetyltransferase NeuD family)